MLIAIPVFEKKLAVHFGHCQEFALVKVDLENKKILSQENITAPPHQPGVLPGWLTGLGVQMIIAGGMGQMAQDLFIKNEIKVLVGVSPDSPEQIVKNYLSGSLGLGQNSCDH